jgi:hypothetical protein
MMASNTEESSMVTICGYGSLLSKESALRTCPSLRNFRAGTVSGFKRVFNLVSVSGLRRNVANWNTKEVAAVVARPSPENVFEAPMLVSVFEIPLAEVEYYKQREARYDFVDVSYRLWKDDSQTLHGQALMCIEFAQGDHDAYVKHKYGDLQKDLYHETLPFSLLARSF